MCSRVLVAVCVCVRVSPYTRVVVFIWPSICDRAGVCPCKTELSASHLTRVEDERVSQDRRSTDRGLEPIEAKLTRQCHALIHSIWGGHVRSGSGTAECVEHRPTPQHEHKRDMLLGEGGSHGELSLDVGLSMLRGSKHEFACGETAWARETHLASPD